MLKNVINNIVNMAEKNKLKKVFIIGGTGFIGSRLSRKLAGKYETVCLVKEEDKDKLRDLNVEIKVGDMFNKHSIERAIENVDVVIHLASSHLKGKEELNLVGSKNIIESCKKKKVNKIVFISSMATKRKILDDYGKTKLKIEELVKKSGLKYTILKPTMVYSEDNLSQIGRSLKMLPFIIPIVGDGNYEMNPVYIEDIIDVIEKSIDNIKTDNKSYDVAGGDKLSFNEIIDISRKRFSIKKIVVHFPISLCLIIFRFFPIISLDAIKGIKESTNADITNLKKDFKINPIKFEEGIKNGNL